LEPSSGRGVGLLEGALAVFAKDLRIELRTGEIVTTAGFFAALVTVLTTITFDSGIAPPLIDIGTELLKWPAGTPLPERATLRLSQSIAPGALWLPIAFASVLALSRTWQREREESALVGLLVSPVPRASIFLGKAAGVFVFVSVVECIVLPIVALLCHLDLLEIVGSLAVVLVLGTLGVATTGTLFGVMTVRTRARDLVFASVLFPLLGPALLSGAAATNVILNLARSEGVKSTLAQLADSDLRDYLLLLGVFDVVGLAGGLLLFGALVED
jgi:heme exporter protein B